MGRLSLDLMGVPLVRHAGRTAVFPTRKALALLVFLAVEGGEQPREKITALFWPESNPTRGRATLRKTLAYLNRALEPETAGPHLIAGRDTLALDPASDLEVDLWTIAQAAQSAKTLPPTGANAAEVLAALQTAARLCRGEFLDGFSLSDAPEFDTWASIQREAWHRQAAWVFDRLAQLQFERGELAGAVDTTARWAAHDPLNEAAHRRLMQLHFAQGDRAAALHAFETCRDILRREVNAEPAPETQKLAGRIRAEPPTLFG